MTEADLSGKLMVVTGANSGIGYQTALALARMGATIAMFCRSPDKGEAARERLAEDSSTAPELFICDFSEPASIREAAACFRSAHDRLDVLVNNAGGYQPERRENSLGHELTGHAGHTRLDDARLFPGNGCQGVPEFIRVFELDLGNAGHSRMHGVGGIEPATQPDLEQ